MGNVDYLWVRRSHLLTPARDYVHPAGRHRVTVVTTMHWARPASAQRFWRQHRRSDAATTASAERAASAIRAWTGRTAHDLGSCALRLHFFLQRFDLGISYVTDPDPVRAVLAAHARHRGEEETQSGGTRSAYSFPWQGAGVDVSVFTDAALARELRLPRRSTPATATHCLARP
jgi:hypothetical protein